MLEWICDHAVYIFMIHLPLQVMRKHFLQDFFSNSEAFASELLKNLGEMFPWYSMESDFK